MKKKILVLWGAEFTHFCLTYALQKKLDAEYYAIIDSPSSHNKFFDSQLLVKLTKKWYLHKQIQHNKNPDIDYLSDVEKKYNLNLWQITLNERIFYRFFNFHKFKRDEILSIEEQVIKFYECVLDEIKPDYLIIKLPHLHHQDLLIKICREKHIKILMLNLSLIGPGTILMQKTNEYDELENFENTKYTTMTFEECNSFLRGTKDNMTRTAIQEKTVGPKLFKMFFHFLFSNNEKINTNYDYYGRTKFRVISFEIKQILRRIIRKKFIDNNLIKNPNLKNSFIYMPLNVDMERAILMDAPYYTNHVETVRSVAKSIPINSWLYVKEHPAQIMRNWRSIKEYKELLEIPNVMLIHPDHPNEDLYRNCKMVISIAGTGSFEAAVFKKPSVILTDLRYDFMPSVERCHSIEELPSIIRQSLNKEIDYGVVSKYFHFVKSIVSDFNWGKFNLEFNSTFYPNSNVDVDISEPKLKEFLNGHENVLDSLAEFHIKKMKFLDGL